MFPFLIIFYLTAYLFYDLILFKDKNPPQKEEQAT